MLLINIALFLVISAIFIAVYKPKSKSDAWLFGIIIPVALFFVVSVFYKFLGYSDVETWYLLASVLGESLISMIISFVVLLVYLKKKFKVGDQFKFPQWLTVAIIVFLVFGLLSEWGSYRWDKRIEEQDSKELNSRIEDKIKDFEQEEEELSSEVEDARKVLPELVALINQGLPVTREGMTMNSMEIKDNAVIVSYVLDETKMDFDKATNDIIEDGLEFFQLANANNKQIMRNIILAEYDYSVEFKASKSGKVKWLTLLASELKDVSIE